METRKRARGGGGGGGSNCNYEKFRGVEENTMVILDTCNSATLHHHLDDRLAFLDAVRSASLVPENGTAPTNKMFEAIFGILKDEDSLSLIIGSYQLLNELDKRYPRAYLSKTEKSGSSSSSIVVSEVIVVEEAWSPFNFRLDITSSEEVASRSSGESIDPLGFQSLIGDIAKRAIAEKCEAVETKSLREILLFQYLLNILEGDFFPRNHAFKENMNWNLLRVSILNMILGSRKVVYKALIQDCLSIMSDFSYDMSESTHDPSNKGDILIQSLQGCDAAVEFALPEMEKATCVALKKLLLMIIELDSARNVADIHGLITRADGARILATELILDGLTYNPDLLSPFFLVFDEPEWKLKLIVQYFQKYIPKSSVRTRRSNCSVEDGTFDCILKCLSNRNSAKSIIKKLSAEVTQLLLSHAFQAYLSLSAQHSAEDDSDSEDVKGSCLVETCKNVISAFTSLKSEDKESESFLFGRGALFTAASILSMKSH